MILGRMITRRYVSSVQLLPRVKEIGGDTNQLVRSALAAVVMELAPILGKVMIRPFQ